MWYGGTGRATAGGYVFVHNPFIILAFYMLTRDAQYKHNYEYKQ